MSASEKLRALDAEAEEEPYDGPCRYGTHHALWDALPLIADVVEAAESIPDVGKLWSQGVHSALTALEEKLG